MDKVQKIREEVERLRSLHQIKYQHLDTNDNMCLVECSMRNLCNDLLLFIDSLQEKPVSEDLEEASKEWLRPQLDKSYVNYGEVKMMELTHFDGYAMLDAIEFGAQWQEKRLLPMIDKICGICQKQQDFINSKDLGELISTLSRRYPEVSFAKLSRIAVKVANWQKNHLWKPADGEDLPEIDWEVIVLTQSYPLEGNEYAVSFAHRPNPDGWDGKSVTTGEVEHYTPKTYDKGGWNIPNIKYWLDVELPKEIEL